MQMFISHLQNLRHTRNGAEKSPSKAESIQRKNHTVHDVKVNPEQQTGRLNTRRQQLNTRQEKNRKQPSSQAQNAEKIKQTY